MKKRDKKVAERETVHAIVRMKIIQITAATHRSEKVILLECTRYFNFKSIDLISVDDTETINYHIDKFNDSLTSNINLIHRESSISSISQHSRRICHYITYVNAYSGRKLPLHRIDIDKSGASQLSYVIASSQQFRAVYT